MPTSDLVLYEPLMRLALAVDPKTVLEVGAGLGAFGWPLRVYLEVCKHDCFKREDWQTTIHGIEVVEDYRTPLHSFVYNEVYWTDMREVLEDMANIGCRYDLVICSQVLEHLGKEDALQCIEWMRKIGRHVLISVPSGYSVQLTLPTWEANTDYEIHRSAWLPEDFPPGWQVWMYGVNFVTFGKGEVDGDD